MKYYSMIKHGKRVEPILGRADKQFKEVELKISSFYFVLLIRDDNVKGDPAKVL